MMPTNGKVSRLQQVAFVIAVILGIGVWYYLLGVFLPYWGSHQPRGVTLTNQFDLYPPWAGAREFVLHGRNPYTPEVTRQIQLGYYGRTVEPGKFSADEQRFAYPLYVVFFLAPTVALPFPAANVVFGVLLLGLTIASVYFWIRGLTLPFDSITKLICVLFVLGSWPVAVGLHTRQLGLAVDFLLACATALIVRGRLRLAGLCLACAMIKPQLAGLLAGCLLIWAIGDWPKRKSLIWIFLISLGALLAGAELALPHWFRDWRNTLPAYLAYTSSKPALERLCGSITGLVLGGLLVCSVAVMCWKMRKHPADSENFGFVVCLVLSTTLVILPTQSLASHNEVLFVPIGLWFFSTLRKSARLTSMQTFALLLAVVAVAWESVASLGLVVASFFARFAISQRYLQIPLYLFFLAPILVTAALVTIMSRTDRKISLSSPGK